MFGERPGGMDKAVGLRCRAEEEADSFDETEVVFVAAAEGGEPTAEDAVCGGSGSDTFVALVSGVESVWLSPAAGWMLWEEVAWGEAEPGASLL